MKTTALMASTILALAACGGEEADVELSSAEQALLQDGNNGGGTAGFYFLGTYGNPPGSFPGTFDAGFKPQMSFEVHHLATCGNLDNVDAMVASFPSSSIILYTATQNYFWTKNAGFYGGNGLNLTTGQCYRLMPKLDGVKLGYSDIHITSGVAAAGYKKVPPGGNIQVSMRLETSLRTDTDTDTIPDWRDNCPTTANTNQADGNGNGIGDACEIVDTDGDTIQDANDNCPTVSNLGQENADGDLFGDACETCDNDPLKSEPGACGCGTADTDTDGDTVPDCIDNCDNDPNKIDVGQCGCGVADTDTDNDGRANCVETCIP